MRLGNNQGTDSLALSEAPDLSNLTIAALWMMIKSGAMRVGTLPTIKRLLITVQDSSAAGLGKEGWSGGT